MRPFLLPSPISPHLRAIWRHDPYSVRPVVLYHAAHAEDDVFERLSGVYGDPNGFVETCKGAPQHLIFTKDRKRGAVQVFSDLNGTTDMHLALDQPFTVLRRTAQGVLIQFDGEEMRDPSGALMTWEFRPLSNPDRYCWHATGSPDAECINTVRLCDSDVPMS